MTLASQLRFRHGAYGGEKLDVSPRWHSLLISINTKSILFILVYLVFALLNNLLNKKLIETIISTIKRQYNETKVVKFLYSLEHILSLDLCLQLCYRNDNIILTEKQTNKNPKPKCQLIAKCMFLSKIVRKAS